jgi:anti-anti-sigma factor
MKIVSDGKTLNVSAILSLAAGDSAAFQQELNAALPDGIEQIDIDLSQTGFVDCGGLGALIAVRNSFRQRLDPAPVTIRLLNPTTPVRRIFSLTRMDHVFPFESH